MKKATTAHDRRWLALALLCMAHLLIVVDVSAVNVALPSIGDEFKVSPEGLRWVVVAYSLTFGGFLLVGGRAADLLGRRAVFVSGLLLFSLASFVCGLAASESVLVAARAVQGLGAAILVPAALSIVFTTFEEEAERNRALGVFGAVGGSGLIAGVLLGGVLTTSLGWEWVFFVNVAIGLSSAVLAPLLITGSQGGATLRTLRSFDLAGATTGTAGLATLVYSVAEAEAVGWDSAQTLGLLVFAAVLLLAFVIVERRATFPLVPLDIFHQRVLISANAVAVLAGTAAYAIFFFVSLYLQQVLGYDPLLTGLAFLPLALMTIVFSNIASDAVTHFSPRPVLAAGFMLLAVSLLWLSCMSAGGAYLSNVMFPTLLAGAGLGFCFVPLTIAAVGSVSPERTGLASALISITQEAGGAVGLAVLVTIAGASTSDAASPEELTAGFQAALATGAGLALGGFMLTLMLVRSRSSRRSPS
jgi:EmrB/QacA subfamily drug resistance transporter